MQTVCQGAVLARFFVMFGRRPMGVVFSRTAMTILLSLIVGCQSKPVPVPPPAPHASASISEPASSSKPTLRPIRNDPAVRQESISRELPAPTPLQIRGIGGAQGEPIELSLGEDREWSAGNETYLVAGDPLRLEVRMLHNRVSRMQFELLGVRSPATIDPKLGIISWPTSDRDVGVHPLRLFIIDQFGRSIRLHFTVQVDPRPERTRSPLRTD